MPEIVTRRISRDKLQAILKIHELVKLVENLVTDVTDTLPSDAALTRDRLQALELGVFGAQDQLPRDVRATGPITIAQDAAGYIISLDFGQLVLAVSAFMPPAPAPAPPADDSQNVLAAQIFRS